MQLKNKVLIGILTIFLTLAFSSPLWAESPGEIIVERIDKSLAVLRSPALQGAEKISERRQKLWEALAPIFNFKEMSRRALGRHWKDRTPEEREEFTSVFTNILKNNYLQKTNSYTNEKIVYLRETAQGDRSKVQTNIITAKGEKIIVDYSMRKIGNTWKIYDITIEGVSVVGNYRSQFNSILSKSPFARLIQQLKEKEREFGKI